MEIKPADAGFAIREMRNQDTKKTPVELPSEITTSYTYNSEANTFVVQFLDESKQVPNKVVKQIPPEYMIEMAAKDGNMRGNVVNTTA